jgi:hypothetical protein
VQSAGDFGMLGTAPPATHPEEPGPVTTTDNYRRFERVDSVEQTPTGLLGRTHGEMLRIDLVR